MTRICSRTSSHLAHLMQSFLIVFVGIRLKLSTFLFQAPFFFFGSNFSSFLCAADCFSMEMTFTQWKRPSRKDPTEKTFNRMEFFSIYFSQKIYYARYVKRYIIVPTKIVLMKFMAFSNDEKSQQKWVYDLMCSISTNDSYFVQF